MPEQYSENIPRGVSENDIDQTVTHLLRKDAEGGYAIFADWVLDQLCNYSLGGNVSNNRYPAWTDENYQTLLRKLAVADPALTPKIAEAMERARKYEEELVQGMQEAVVSLLGDGDPETRMSDAVSYLTQDQGREQPFYNRLAATLQNPSVASLLVSLIKEHVQRWRDNA